MGTGGAPCPATAKEIGFQQRRSNTAAERRHPTGRETMGSPTLQTLQEPILLLPGPAFERRRFSKPGSHGAHTGGGEGDIRVRHDEVAVQAIPPTLL
jgi:hypothetical protein